MIRSEQVSRLGEELDGFVRSSVEVMAVRIQEAVSSTAPRLDPTPARPSIRGRV